jgi:hypothetical protein
MQFSILGPISGIETIANNDGYIASLEKRKIYLALPDSEAEQRGLIRVIDESGEDYLYPKEFFRSVDLPTAVKKALLSAA